MGYFLIVALLVTLTIFPIASNFVTHSNLLEFYNQTLEIETDEEIPKFLPPTRLFIDSINQTYLQPLSNITERSEIICTRTLRFAGDSLQRNLFVSYLNLFGKSKNRFSESDFIKTDYSFTFYLNANDAKQALSTTTTTTTAKFLIDTDIKCFNGVDTFTVEFYWIPYFEDGVSYISKVTERSTQSQYDIDIFGLGSWDMCFINNEELLEPNILNFTVAIDSMQTKKSNVLHPFVYINIGPFEESKLVEHRRNMTTEKAKLYNSKVMNGLGMLLSSVLVFDRFQFLSDASNFTTDGIHLKPFYNNLMLQLISDQLNHELLEVYKKENSITTNSKQATTGFIGSDPIMGLFVGLYILLVFITQDPFLISFLLLYIFGDSNRKKYPSFGP